jgi:predicted permease
VAIASSVTMEGNNSNDALEVEEFPTPEGQLPPIRRFKWIAPGYFETMGNPLIAGRDLNWTDIYERRPVGVISEPLARAHWDSAQAALGRRVRAGMKGPWREIVGVVAGDRDDGVAEDPVAVAYWPLALEQWWDEDVFVYRWMTFAVRSPRVGSPALLDEMREAVWAVNPDLPLASVQTLAEIHQRSLARTSFAMTMLAIAAGMALLLGAVGVYGVISYSVAQRTREIGVRMALGAQRAQVSRLVLRQGLVLTGIGVAVGATAALGLGHVMQALLYGVEARDPATIAAVSLILALIGVVATALPAHRAASVDPIEALRWE